MKARRLLNRAAAVTAILAAGATVFLGAAAEPDRRPVRSKTRDAMRDIYQSLTRVYLLSLDEAEFENPSNAGKIRGSLERIAGKATQLERHAAELGPMFEGVRRSFERDASFAVARFEEGEHARARAGVRRLVDSCFACHSKLPSEHEYGPAAGFIRNRDVRTMPPEDRVRLEVATRRFEAALKTYESILRSPTKTAGEIVLMNVVEDYLKVALRVREDPARTIETLEAFLTRPDTHRFLAISVDNWLESLRKIDAPAAGGDRLALARALIRDGRMENVFPADRQGLVYFIAASSQLHRYLEEGAAGKPGTMDRTDLAEAYYLLGVAESFVSRSFVMSETEHFLEMAIRVDPASPHAVRALSFLEDYVLAGYSGSAGLDVPPDVSRRLDELRGIVNRAAGSVS